MAADSTTARTHGLSNPCRESIGPGKLFSVLGAMNAASGGPSTASHATGARTVPDVSGDLVEKVQHLNQNHDAHSRGRRPGGLTDLSEDATRDVGAALSLLLADIFALYLKTKNFHWHMSGPNFRDYHLMLDEQGEQIFAMTDPVAERARKLGSKTLRSIGEIARRQRIADNDADYVDSQDMLAELRENNRHLIAAMRQVHNTCSENGDVGTTSLLEVWIDEAEKRSWFLYEASHRPPRSNA